jgi:hypothetical protein
MSCLEASVEQLVTIAFSVRDMDHLGTISENLARRLDSPPPTSAFAFGVGYGFAASSLARAGFRAAGAVNGLEVCDSERTSPSRRIYNERQMQQKPGLTRR